MADHDPRPTDEEPLASELLWPEDVTGIPLIYANQLYISHAGPEFILTFGVVTPPLLRVAGMSPKQLETLRERYKQIEVQVVARLAISPEAMVSMADTIQNNVERYRERLETAGQYEGEVE